MKMTSAYANKLLKQLNETKEYYENIENESFYYIAEVDEEPVVPEYDYQQVADEIQAIDEKIMKIKHAINVSNSTNLIEVGDQMYTVDQILIRMAQKNKRKDFLDMLRKQQPKSRVNQDRFTVRRGNPEYQYINYDMDLIKKEYEKVAEEVMMMQMALDKYNQTMEIEIDIHLV